MGRRFVKAKYIAIKDGRKRNKSWAGRVQHQSEDLVRERLKKLNRDCDIILESCEWKKSKWYGSVRYKYIRPNGRATTTNFSKTLLEKSESQLLELVRKKHRGCEFEFEPIKWKERPQ